MEVRMWTNQAAKGRIINNLYLPEVNEHIVCRKKLLIYWARFNFFLLPFPIHLHYQPAFHAVWHCQDMPLVVHDRGTMEHCFFTILCEDDIGQKHIPKNPNVSGILSKHTVIPFKQPSISSHFPIDSTNPTETLGHFDAVIVQDFCIRASIFIESGRCMHKFVVSTKVHIMKHKIPFSTH